jgi:hypothetical protein
MQEFEQFIIKCCEMDEWDLRDFLREELTKAGFKVQEDDYVSCRPGKYKTIRNMLAIRGEDARVCLVAHTDVCRDHGWGRSEHKKANPIIKEVERNGESFRIIQDENCEVQTGGDDRLGVAINTWTALNTEYDMGLLYTLDEEIGNQSAEHCKFPELMNFDLCAQVDRGNHSNQLVIEIGGLRLCNNDMARRLLGIADDIGLPREPVRGMMTDVLALTENRRIKAAVNMTCGYHNSFGSSADEYIHIEEACDTLKYVQAIINDFAIEVIDENDSNDLTIAETLAQSYLYSEVSAGEVGGEPTTQQVISTDGTMELIEQPESSQ